MADKAMLKWLGAGSLAGVSLAQIRRTCMASSLSSTAKRGSRVMRQARRVSAAALLTSSCWGPLVSDL